MAETYEQFAPGGRNPVLLEHGTLGWWNSEESAIEFARRINEAADVMAGHGFEFGYSHSIPEFDYLDEEEEKRAYDVFLEHVDDHVNLQLDVAWAYAGEGRPDPIDYITEHGHQFGSLHMQNWTADDERPDDGPLGNLPDPGGAPGEPAEEVLGAFQDAAGVDDPSWALEFVRKTR